VAGEDQRLDATVATQRIEHLLAVVCRIDAGVDNASHSVGYRAKLARALALIEVDDDVVATLQ
jgi:hypothetical protein